MLADTPAHTRRAGTRAPSASPLCRTAHTPTTLGHPTPGPSLCSPSPFHSTFAFPSSSAPDDTDADGPDFTSSPFMSPPPRKVHGRLPALHSSVARPPPMPIDDDEGGIFLASTPRASPLRGRGSLENSFRAALSPIQTSAAATRVGKRKSTPSLLNSPDVTPFRQRVLTPLNTAPGNFSFDRLAPLPAPRFGQSSTPPSKADTDASLHKQTASMTRLRIVEHHDSGPDSDEEDEKVVAAAISPDGHVTKRRARSRPVSVELRGRVHSPPATSQLAFPSGPSLNFSPSDPASPTSSSSSDATSPFRRRMSSSRGVRTRTASNVAHLRPIPMARIPSGASVFFGPAIPNSGCPSSRPAPTRPVLSTRHSFAGSGTISPWANSPEKPTPKRAQFEDEDEDMFFSGLPDTSFSFDGIGASSPNRMVSQGRGLPKKYKPRDSGVCLSEEEEQSFRLGAALAALEKSSDWGVPSASTSVSTVQSSGDELAGLVTPMIGPGDTSGWPRALVVGADGEVEEEDDLADASFRTQPEIVDEFIKRTLAAGGKDHSVGGSVPEEHGGKRAPGTPVKKARTAFTGGRPWQSAFANGKIGFSFGSNGEPVPTGKVKDKKKARMSMPAALQAPGAQEKTGKRKLPGLALAVSRRTIVEDSDSEGDKDSPSAMRQMKFETLGMGRPARPTGVAARARMLMRRSSSGQFESGSESPGSAGTPTRLSKVWPTPRLPSQLSPASATFKSHRKNSSSSGSFGSPTIRRVIKDLPISSPKPLRSRKSGVELFDDYVEVPSFRLPASKPGPSSLAYPTHTQVEEVAVPAAPHIPRVRLASMTAEDHRDGYFEREFVEIDDLGSGEFGKAMKVRRKDGPETDVFAVKRSRRFEGSRQRLRLREELDVLRHLSRATKAQGLGERHPNVLAYVDGWEQDETLYILTELCELGNYASFLWRFGTIFPRLDEARVWKILADLSNGLRFIHDNGVIHLDLKPANIFVTADGRFKIGDFGMASLWPRPPQTGPDAETSFEREGDKLYLAAEVLQGQYGKAADIFSLGMMMLETAANIVVPDQGEPWHRLRHEDFSQVEDMDASPELYALIRAMMRADPAARVPVADVHAHPVVARARAAMERQAAAARAAGASLYAASPLAGVEDGFLEAILGRPALLGPSLARVDEDEDAMDLSA